MDKSININQIDSKSIYIPKVSGGGNDVRLYG